MLKVSAEKGYPGFLANATASAAAGGVGRSLLHGTVAHARPGRGAGHAPRRRTFCAAGAAALLGLAASPGTAGARTFQEDSERRVPIRNLWTGERRDLVYWRDGTYDRHALEAYSYLMRDRRNGEVEPIFYGVLDQLFFLWKALERPARIDLVSGYRSAGTNAWLRAKSGGVARSSLHTIGMAADIRVPGLATEAVWRAAVDLRRAAPASTAPRTSSTSTWARCEAGSSGNGRALAGRPRERRRCRRIVPTRLARRR